MDRRIAVSLFLMASAACSRSEAPAAKTAGSGITRDRDSRGRQRCRGRRRPTARRRRRTRARAPAKLRGGFPVLEYHVIAGDKNTLYTRTAASYRADLEEAYKRGYRPITIAQMLDKDFRDVPAGMSPVVFVFDDASDSQFRYLEQNGKARDRSDERGGHLGGLREVASRLEEPRGVLHAERRRGGPQLLRRQSEVRRAEEGVALPEGEVARRSRASSCAITRSGT